MAVEFTKEQQAVIDARDCNILVSAAAGSGKTAVLVERIIQMIMGGVDIDHLLVVTFTKAAAAQMKEKITIAIQNKLVEEPDNKHLQRQETLIHNAQITTIDSFCQYVLRNNFNVIGIDPSFRVGDDGELRLLKEDVMQDMLEEEYANCKDGENSDFLFCMEYFSTGSSDKKVEEYISELYKFAMSMPWPEDWIRERSMDYHLEGVVFDELPWVKRCVEKARTQLEEMVSSIEMLEKVCCESDGPHMYGDNLDADKASIQAALKYDTYDQLFDGLRGISFGTLSRKRDPSVNPDKKEYVKNERGKIKDKIVKGLIPGVFALPSETIVDQMALCDRAVKELCRLTIRYKQLFDEKKREKQLIDFPDMEHFALQILVNHPDEEEAKGKTCAEIIEMCTPSAVALEYRDYYREVLIDEYQDSNNVQELMLRSISGNMPDKSERFMVGDVKQSIYKFRLARPEIFMEKLHSYDKNEKALDRRIDLHKNFRSRKEVLEATNYIFEKIMGADLGSVDYDEDAKLVTGADYYEEPTYNVTPELILFDKDSDNEALSDFDSKEKEALVIAERIHKLMDEDKNLRFKDMVILLRSLSGWDDVFKKVLEEQGIPTYIESKSGYFEAYEVAVILYLLTIVDNPSQDIPLVSVMHSPIGGFTDEELARLRVMVKEDDEASIEDSLYYGLKALARGSDEVASTDKVGLMDEAASTDKVVAMNEVASAGKAGAINEVASTGRNALMDKLVKFIDFVEELRTISIYTPVHELLQHIMDETGFDKYCLAMPAGNQRKANLDLLMARALSFEKTSFKGLFHFVRYIEHMKLVEVDYGEAGIIDENADVVRIMSIHKSKGLEFPVVFVSGLTKGFNLRDTKGDLIVDMDLGIGVKSINSELRVKYDTLKRIIIADKMKTDSLGEELRVLYVALTRAKEKLIMTGALKKPLDAITKEARRLPVIAGKEKLLPYSLRESAGSYLDLILPSVVSHPGFSKGLAALGVPDEMFRGYQESESQVPGFSFVFLSDDEIVSDMLKDDVMGISRQQELSDAVKAYSGEEAERLREKFEAKYPFEYLKGLFTKTTVTELKKHMLEEMGEVFTHSADYAEERNDDIELSSGLEEHQTLDPEVEFIASASGSADNDNADSGNMINGTAVSDSADNDQATSDNVADGTEDNSRNIKKIKRLTGAERGTAYHRIMEILDKDIYGNEKLMQEARDIYGNDELEQESGDIKSNEEFEQESGDIKSNEELEQESGDIRSNEELEQESGDIKSNEEPMQEAENIKTEHRKIDPVSRRIYGWMKGMISKGMITEEYLPSIWCPDITTFLSTDLGQRMGMAFRRGELVREKPFMMGIPASELDDKYPESETVLIQGIIDAWFIEDGQIVLLDYKTDRVQEEQELVDRYSIQLDLYKRALESATNMKVKEVFIYAFALGKVIKM